MRVWLTGWRSTGARRDAARTPEPVPKRPARRQRRRRARFVIQQHHARSLHWDLRLEHEGVLASWAVPRGLPRDPGRNHLAVHTEDHPMEYLDFHGEIPAGEYGGGRMTDPRPGHLQLREVARRRGDRGPRR